MMGRMTWISNVNGLSHWRA